MVPWHEQDAFWDKMAPVLFTDDVIKEGKSDVDRVLKLANVSGPCSVLDVACGIGRHAVAFAKLGHHVTGIDRTRSYLDRARDMANDAGCKVEFVESDIRKFERKNTFDLVVVLWNTFGYFSDPADDLEALKLWNSSLKRGGRLVIQTLGKEHIARRARRGGRDWFERAGHLELIERKISADWESQETRVILVFNGTRSDLSFSSRLYAGTEVAHLLSKAGFSGHQLYSDLDGAPYNALTGQHDVYSGQLVVMATK